MRRLLLGLLALGTLVLLGLLVPGAEDPGQPHADVSHRGPEGAVPLPGLREEPPSEDAASREARLRGRAPPDEPRNLTVHVVGPDGTPVPQAFLIVERGAGEDWTEWVETVAGGVALVAGPAIGQLANVEVVAPKSAEAKPLPLLPRRVEGIRPGAAEIVVRLGWSRRLRGTVRTTDGEPVEGASVRAAPPARFSAGRQAISDEEGRFEIVGLPPGYLTARLEKNERWVTPTTLSVAAGQVELTIEVDPLVPFEVTVLDPRGHPLAGVLLNAQWVMHCIGRQQSAETDAQGKVLLPSVPRSAELHVFTEWHEGAPDFPDVQVDQVPARDGALVLRMPEPVAIEGTVLDASGQLLRVGEVSATLVDGTAFQATDVEDGRFCLGRLNPGRYRLRVNAPTSFGRGDPIEAVAPGRDVVIHLAPLFDVTGRVLGANPEGIVVQWFVQGAQAPQVHVTRDGSFRFAPARDRPGTLYAFDPHAGACALLEGLRPTDGPFEVRCVAGHRIAGRILAYADRTPRPRLLCVRGPVKLAVRVQPDGSFEVPTAPSGTWRLVWALGSRLEDAIEVEAGTQDVMLSPPDAPGEER